MFKEFASKAFKFIGASLGVLVAAYTIGWSGAITLHSLFKANEVEAQAFVVDQVSKAENKMMLIREADLSGINGKFEILIQQNNLIISQNYRTRKAIESQNQMSNP